MGRFEDLTNIKTMELLDAQRTIQNKDVLIQMLREQLKKIEDKYKQNMSETEQIRYKYCVVNDKLEKIKNRKKAESRSTIRNMHEDMEEWKDQCEKCLRTRQEDLFKEKIESLEKIMKKHYSTVIGIVEKLFISDIKFIEGTFSEKPSLDVCTIQEEMNVFKRENQRLKKELENVKQASKTTDLFYQNKNSVDEESESVPSSSEQTSEHELLCRCTDPNKTARADSLLNELSLLLHQKHIGNDGEARNRSSKTCSQKRAEKTSIVHTVSKSQKYGRDGSTETEGNVVQNNGRFRDEVKYRDDPSIISITESVPCKLENQSCAYGSINSESASLIFQNYKFYEDEKKPGGDFSIMSIVGSSFNEEKIQFNQLLKDESNKDSVCSYSKKINYEPTRYEEKMPHNNQLPDDGTKKIAEIMQSEPIPNNQFPDDDKRLSDLSAGSVDAYTQYEEMIINYELYKGTEKNSDDLSTTTITGSLVDDNVAQHDQLSKDKQKNYCGCSNKKVNNSLQKEILHISQLPFDEMKLCKCKNHGSKSVDKSTQHEDDTVQNNQLCGNGENHSDYFNTVTCSPSPDCEHTTDKSEDMGIARKCVQDQRNLGKDLTEQESVTRYLLEQIILNIDGLKGKLNKFEDVVRKIEERTEYCMTEVARFRKDRRSVDENPKKKRSINEASSKRNSASGLSFNKQRAVDDPCNEYGYTLEMIYGPEIERRKSGRKSVSLSLGNGSVIVPLKDRSSTAISSSMDEDQISDKSEKVDWSYDMFGNSTPENLPGHDELTEMNSKHPPSELKEQNRSKYSSVDPPPDLLSYKSGSRSLPEVPEETPMDESVADQSTRYWPFFKSISRQMSGSMLQVANVSDTKLNSFPTRHSTGGISRVPLPSVEKLMLLTQHYNDLRKEREEKSRQIENIEKLLQCYTDEGKKVSDGQAESKSVDDYLQFYIGKVIDENGKLKSTIETLLTNVKSQVDELNKNGKAKRPCSEIMTKNINAECQTTNKINAECQKTNKINAECQTSQRRCLCRSTQCKRNKSQRKCLCKSTQSEKEKNETNSEPKVLSQESQKNEDVDKVQKNGSEKAPPHTCLFCMKTRVKCGCKAHDTQTVKKTNGLLSDKNEQAIGGKPKEKINNKDLENLERESFVRSLENYIKDLKNQLDITNKIEDDIAKLKGNKQSTSL